MQVTNVRLSKTVQVSQYEPETVEFSAVLEEGECHVEAAQRLREEAYAFFGKKSGRVDTARTTTSDAKGEEAQDDTKEESPKAGKGTKKVVKKSSSNGDDSDKTTKKKVTKKKVTSKKKNIAYDRDVKAHKTQLGKLLHENFPGWKEDEDMAANAKEASMSLAGVDFLDAEGNVLDSFIEALTEAMGGDEEL